MSDSLPDGVPILMRKGNEDISEFEERCRERGGYVVIGDAGKEFFCVGEDWFYPVIRCRWFPCPDPLVPLCLILYRDQDRLFREAVRKFDLNEDEATVVAAMFKGCGVCRSYVPEREPVNLRRGKVKEAVEYLEERWPD